MQGVRVDINYQGENFTNTIESLVNEIVSYIKTSWYFENVLVYVYDEKQRKVKLFRDNGNCDERLKNINEFSIDTENLFSLSFNTGRYIHLVDNKIVSPADFPDSKCVYCGYIDAKECLIIPSIHKSKKNGIFILYNENNKLKILDEQIHNLCSFIKSISGVIDIIKNQYVFETLRQNNNRVIELIKKISSIVELEKLLDLMLDEIKDVFDFDGCFIAISDILRENLIFEKIIVPEQYDDLAMILLKTSISLTGNDIINNCFNECKVFQFNEDNIQDYVYNANFVFELWKTKYMTFVPFAKNKESIGVIVFISSEFDIPDNIISSIWKLLELFYDQVKNAELFKRVKEMEREIEIHAERNRKIFEIVQNTNGLKTTDEIYKIILNELLHILNFDLGFIFIRENDYLNCKYENSIDESNKHILENYLNVIKDLDGLKLSKELGVIQFAFMNNTHVYFPELDKIMHLPMTTQDVKFKKVLSGIKSMLMFPIILKQKPIGIIQMCSLKKSIYLNQSDIKIIKTISPLIGNSISNAKLYSKLEAHVSDLKKQRGFLIKLSYSDQLTGIRNRRYFEQRVIDEYKKFKRYQEPLFIFMMDVDNFKNVNDTYGHEAGDLVLKDIVHSIQTVIRESDLFARYGGDEFVILALKTDRDGAKVLAEKIIDNVKDIKVSYDGNQIKVTISIGISSLINNDDIVKEDNDLITQADKALYKAKEKGKNTFCFYE